MITTITTFENSPAIILDAALLKEAGLKVGDQVNVEVEPGA
jgi:antitoxin component of MazEF toxin-antitoxin module